MQNATFSVPLSFCCALCTSPCCGKNCVTYDDCFEMFASSHRATEMLCFFTEAHVVPEDPGIIPSP